MANTNTIIQVGPFQARLGTVAANLYLNGSPIVPEDHEDAFYDGNPAVRGPSLLETTEAFLEGLGRLLDTLLDMDRYGTFTEEEVQYEFYEAAKLTFGTEKNEIREFFRLLYLLVTRTPNGPRWGQFVLAFGLDNFIDLLQSRCNELPAIWSMPQ